MRSSTKQSEIPWWLVLAAFLIGVVLIFRILSLEERIPNPTETQFNIIRSVIALAGSAFATGITGFLTIQFHWSRGKRIVAGGALAVFVILYFVSPAIPNISKPLVDKAGHTLESPANEAEKGVLQLQDDIMELRQYKESVQYPDSRRKLKDASYLAKRILSFRDDDLNPRRRYIKYEYAAFAYVDAAAAAMFDDPSKVTEYASHALENTNQALSLLKAAEAGDPSDENTSFMLDWVQKDNGKDRVLYLRADAFCMMGIATKDSKLKEKAFETWNLISEGYRTGLPASGSPQLSGCVSK